MKKVPISLLLIWSMLFNSFAIGVDSEEVRTDKNVNFINYSGAQAVSPASVIKGIGGMLSRNLKQRQDGRGMYYNKYIIIHAINESEPEKLDADVLQLTETAGVNHIGGLRLIIAGYLEEQYGYSLNEARLLAYFITIYNAVYRKDLVYFGSKYKQNVMQYLSLDKAGLATRYDQWAGETQLVIPIVQETRVTETAPESNVDSSPLADDKVLETIREQEDKGIPERKELVNLRETEVAEDKQEVEVAKEEIAADKEQLAEDKAQQEERQAEIAQKEEELTGEKEKLETITDPEEKNAAESDIAAKEEQLSEQKKEAAALEEEITRDEESIAEREQNVEKKEQEIAAKEEQINQEKQDIAKDEKIVEAMQDPEKFAEELVKKEEELKVREENLINEQLDERTFAGKFYYLRVEEYLSGGHYNNSLFTINATTGEVLTKSPVANITGRKYDIAPNVGVVVIIHKGVGSEYNYISILDLDTLESKFVSEDPVFHRSFVEVRGDYIYVIANLNNSYYLGKYDLELNRVALSREKVFEDSYITFFSDRIYINDRNDKIMVLSNGDLSLIERISPE